MLAGAAPVALGMPRLAELCGPGALRAFRSIGAPLELRRRMLLAMANATDADASTSRDPAATAIDRAGGRDLHPQDGGDGSDGGTGDRGPTTAGAAAALSMEELVQDHADAVYRVALSITKDVALAEDASQNTLIKAWQALPSYRADAPLRHWILRIAHNESVSLLRRRREQSVSPFEMVERPSIVRSVEVEVEDRLAIERFEVALGDLDVTSRSIVILREIEGLAYNEICEVLDLTLPTVRTRLLRARRTLANALEGWQP